MLAAALMAFLIGAAATWAWLRVAGQHMLDVPGGLSSHAAPTPRGGGVGLLAGFLAGLGIAHGLAIPSDPRLPLAAAATLLPVAAVGLVDDARGLSVGVRLAVHLAAGAAAVGLLGSVAPGWLQHDPRSAMVLSALGVTALLSFYNFMDGVDGLVGGSSAVQLAFLAHWTGDPAWAAATGAAVGFLLWNWPPARVFLGDTGSTAIGALIGLGVLSHWQALPGDRLVVTLPIVGDALYTLLRRAVAGQNLLRAHHSHVYQRLLRSGLGHRAISLGYGALTLLCGTAATVGGTRGAVLAAGLCAIALVAAEHRIVTRRVPFLRPAVPAQDVPDADRLRGDAGRDGDRGARPRS